MNVRVIDSHTGGEPTRVVVEGLPDLGAGDMRHYRELLRTHHDWIRTALTLEPRGAPWMVGAALLPPSDPTSAAGVVFFNNTGYLGMCGHGLIGVVATLAHLGQVQPGRHQFETPAGVVTAELHPNGDVSFENVRSRRTQADVVLQLPSGRQVVGEIAYGGNWFFLTPVPRVEPELIGELTALAKEIKQALAAAGLAGDDGDQIDHIELTAPANDPAIDARNFVLCPGDQFDRSPCGTGTSAKVACLAAAGKLAPDEPWVQQSVLGTTFTARYRPVAGGVVPTIRGRAFVTGEATLIAAPDDPLRWGFDPARAPAAGAGPG